MNEVWILLWLVFTPSEPLCLGYRMCIDESGNLVYCWSKYEVFNSTTSLMKKYDDLPPEAEARIFKGVEYEVSGVFTPK